MLTLRITGKEGGSVSWVSLKQGYTVKYYKQDNSVAIHYDSLRLKKEYYLDNIHLTIYLNGKVVEECGGNECF